MISDKFIAKIEGHGNLTIDWKNKAVKMNVHEGERLFEGMLVNRTIEEMHWITPRICGVCPVAHNLASLKAAESAYGIKPSRTTILLRRLIMTGQMIQSHVLHLFFLSLPDYLGIDRGTELVKKNPKAFGSAIALKDVSDKIVKVVGGRSIHPTATVIGGFRKYPTKTQLKLLLSQLEETAQDAETAVRICADIDYPDIQADLELVSQTKTRIPKEFTAYESDFIVSTKIGYASVEEYKNVIEEEIKSYSTAKFSRFRGKEVLVGSLARIAIQGVGLAPELNKYLAKVDFDNPYHNNLAQGIEIVHFHQEARDIIKELLDFKLDEKPIKPAKHPSLKGFGAVEAPRGGLYNEVHLTKEGKISYANIITPTVQNLTSIEKSAQAVLEQTKNLSREKRERLLTMLVRAYDPCITCSVH